MASQARPRSRSDVVQNWRYPAYIYQPLESARHIRLISILHYDPILSQVYVALDHASLDNVADKFTALSYTWGSPVADFAKLRSAPAPLSSLRSPQTVQLIVVPPEAFETFKRADDLAADGPMLDMYTTPVARIGVGENLSDWFRNYLDGWPVGVAARFSGANAYERRVFWIDAVCIDQASPIEKAAQIPLMGEIYSTASRVLAWLGANTTDLDIFWWWHGIVLPQLGDFLENGGAEALTLLREADFTGPAFWSETLSLEPFSRATWLECWMAYWAFYRSCQYFHRAWIVQEAVLSRRLQLQCAGAELDWEALNDFAYLLGRTGWIDLLDVIAMERLPTEYTKAITRGFGITDIYGMQLQSKGLDSCGIGWPQRWWSAISAVRRRDCLLPQDKIFATVGILQQALPKSIDLPFIVNPDATPEEVYTRTAKVLLSNCPSLTVLSFVEMPFRRNLQELPSWVPDMTTAKFPWPIGDFDTPFSAGFPPRNSFDGAPPVLQPAVVAPNGELRVRGIAVDRIAKTYSYCPPAAKVRLAETILQALVDTPATYSHALGGGQSRVAALIHTMTCQEVTNTYRGTADETGRLAISFRAWLLASIGQIWLGCLLVPGDEGYDAKLSNSLLGRRLHAVELLQNIGPESLLPSIDDLDVHAAAMYAARKGEAQVPNLATTEFNDQVQRLILHRCIYRTDDGWLGLCAQTCQKGDEVWVLERGSVPYVLRRRKEKGHQETYEFAGECYAHGLMHGEFMEGNSLERLQDVRIS
jgi:hypothetical protein